MEILCLDHFSVAMSNLSHDFSREISKNCDSQRSGDPGTQHFRTGDDKKGPCGDRKKNQRKLKEINSFKKA